MTTKKTRIKHSPEFKAEALKLADKVGVAAAARQLSLHESQIYGWRKNSKKDTNTSQREQELSVEVAKLKRQLAEQAEELEIVKKGRYLLRIWNPRVLQDKNVQWIRCGRIFGFLLKELPSNL